MEPAETVITAETAKIAEPTKVTAISAGFAFNPVSAVSARST